MSQLPQTGPTSVKPALDQLAESHAAIINALPAHIALLDPHGIILVVNDSWKHFATANVLQSENFGVGTNYLQLCESAIDGCSTEAREAARGLRGVLDGTLADFSLEYPCHSPSEQIWFRLIVTPVSPGQRAGAVVMHVNITERRLTQEALRQSEHEQRQLVRQLEAEKSRLVAAQSVAKIGSWETDLATLQVIWSAETHRIFETDPATFLPTHEAFLAKVHPADRTGVDQAFSASWTKLGAQVIQHRLLMADRRIKFVEERWHIVRDEQGRPQRAIGTCRDITEQRKSDEAIRLQAYMLDHIGQAVIATDTVGKITYANRFAGNLYGWKVPEMLGRNVLEVTVPQTTRDQAGEIMAHLQRGESWSGEFQVQSRTGRIFPALVTNSPLLDEQGHVTGIIGISQDVSESRKLEQQFLRAQRMESIGTLAGGIAHDLNNLLAPIMMGVELLRQFDPNPKALPVIENMQQSARRGADLVKQVLSFARGVEGLRTPIRVNHVITEVQSIIENTFPKNITIKVDLAKDLWPVLADPTQLNQVLLNLCVNARDALSNGGRLELRVGNIEIDQQYAAMNRGVVPGRYVVIHVIDSGCGMPPEVIDRIFEPFFTTKEVGKGTGLGLSTALGIVRSHGGFVNVYSEPGKGSTFKVYLPTQTEGAPATDTVQLAEKLPRGHGELVMVVDDEANIREITKATLETFGYRVITAEDGAQAIALYALQRSEIAVVITDMMMPVMDGPVLIAALQRINPEVCVIAASGLSANANVARAATSGVKHFLAKPYPADALLTLLKTVLTENTGLTPVTPPP